jgi:hypothetical protein
MSSYAHYRCSEEPAARTCDSLKTPIYPNQRGRRKWRIDHFFIALSKVAAQLLVLPVAALCTIIIQTYTPVPHQVPPWSSNSPDPIATAHLLDIWMKLEFLRRWIESARLGIWQILAKQEGLESVLVRS